MLLSKLVYALLSFPVVSWDIVSFSAVYNVFLGVPLGSEIP